MRSGIEDVRDDLPPQLIHRPTFIEHHGKLTLIPPPASGERSYMAKATVIIARRDPGVLE
jgi:hypothetical protein